MEIHFVDPYNYVDLLGLLERLENEELYISEHIAGIVSIAEDEVSAGQEKPYVIPHFAGELEVIFSKHSYRRESSNVLCRRSTNRPIFYSQDEFKKLGDLICNPKILNQMPIDMINVLVITTTSNTHEDIDLGFGFSDGHGPIKLRGGAISAIHDRIRNRDDAFFIRKGFSGGITEFVEQSKKLSGIVFRNPRGTINGCIFWPNKEANRLISESLKQALSLSLGS